MTREFDDLPDTVLEMWRREALMVVPGSNQIMRELVVQLVAVIDELRRTRGKQQGPRRAGPLLAPPACGTCGRLMVLDNDGETMRCLRCEGW